MSAGGPTTTRTSTRLRKGDHSAFVVAHIDPVNVIDPIAIRCLRLDLDLPPPAKQIDVIDVKPAKRSLQRLKDSVKRYAENLRLIPVDIEKDRRVCRRKGRKHAAELRILVSGND